MCEILAVRWPAPRPFSVLVERARAMEHYGSGRFGWGVAWVADGQVQAHLDTGAMADDAAVGGYLGAVESDRFLVHFRRPTLLSTIQLADTQPFVSREMNFAFVHNGLFKERDAYRPDYAGRLTGAADSEIGFCMLQDFLAAGVSASDALAMVAAKLGGNANLVTLDGAGAITLYSKHETNRFWRFTDGDGEFAATEVHSADDSLFRLIFPAASARSVLDESVLL